MKEINDFIKKAEKFLKTTETTDVRGDCRGYSGDGSRVGRVAGECNED